MGCTNVTITPPISFHYDKIVSVVIKKCSIKLDYNFKMFDKTRLQLHSPIATDMVFS